MRLIDGRLAGGDLEHDLDLAKEANGEVLAVVELDAVGALLLERREERLGLGLVDGLGRAGSPPPERVGEEEEDEYEDQNAPRAAGKATRQHVQRRHAEAALGSAGGALRAVGGDERGGRRGAEDRLLGARGRGLGHWTAGRQCAEG